MDSADLALSAAPSRQHRLGSRDLQRILRRGGRRPLRRVAVQCPTMVLREQAARNRQVSAANGRVGVFVKLGVQPVHVVAGGYRRSLRVACPSYRRVSYALLFLGAASGEQRANAWSLLCFGALIQQPSADDCFGASSLSSHPFASAASIPRLVFRRPIDSLARLSGFCNPVEERHCPQDGNKVLLLRRAGICSFPLAAQFSRPLEIDRLPSAGGSSRAPSLRLHALRLSNQSAHELGIYARRRRFFLFDRPLSIPRQPVGSHREIPGPIDGDRAAKGDKRLGSAGQQARRLPACRVVGGIFPPAADQSIFDRRFARVFCLVSVLVRLFASQARMDLFSSSGVCSLGVSAAFASGVKD